MKNHKYFNSIAAWSCITFFYCYQYILRLIPNLIMPELISKYNISAEEFGAYAGIYYIGYIAVHIPLGILLARVGSKVVLPVCILVAASGLIPLIYFDSWELVKLGRLLVGFGSSACIIAAFQIFRIIFHSKFSRMLGAMVCVGLISASNVSTPLAAMIMNMGIEPVVQLLLVSGVALAAITFAILPQIKSSHDSANWSGVIAILTNKKLIMVSILGGLMVAPLEGFADAWGTAFINVVYGIERGAAGVIVTSILTGMCIGSLVLPYLSERYKSYYGVTFISSCAMLVIFTAMIGQIGNAEVLYAFCLLLGVFSAYQVVILSRIAMYVPEKDSSLAASIGNMIIMSFGFFFHNTIGKIMDYNWANTLADDGSKIYSVDAYIYSISIIPIALLIASIGFLLVIIDNKRRSLKV